MSLHSNLEGSAGSAYAPSLAVILARGGSKGVPRKNLAPIADLPCIVWSIDAARRSHLVGEVAVSTDDPEIAGVAREHGASTIMRPADLASDTATVDDAARHAVLEWERLAAGRAGDSKQPESSERPIVILYANVPVRPEGLIDRAVQLLLETGCDSVQSYAAVGKYHPWWMAKIDEQGRVAPWEGEVLNHGIYRRQDLPPVCVPDGGVLVVQRRSLFLEIEGVPPGPHAFFGHDRRGIQTREGEVVDIDAPMDVMMADALMREQLTSNLEKCARRTSMH